jgi:hypothetical protein
MQTIRDPPSNPASPQEDPVPEPREATRASEIPVPTILPLTN